MLPRILTLLITTARSAFNHRDETLWTLGRGKAHNYFRFYSEGSPGGEDVVFTQRRLPNLALGKLCDHQRKWLFVFWMDAYERKVLEFKQNNLTHVAKDLSARVLHGHILAI